MFRKQHSQSKASIGSRGFTILEAVIALAIFSIGILAVAGMQISSTSGNASARFTTEAATLAQDLLERLLSLRYDPAAPLAEFDDTQNGSRAYADPTGRYTIDWTVSPPHTPLNNAVTIDVFVVWKSYGRTRSYNLNSIKSAEI
jgi:type IV pilus assembly protein PilV